MLSASLYLYVFIQFIIIYVTDAIANCVIYSFCTETSAFYVFDFLPGFYATCHTLALISAFCSLSITYANYTTLKNVNLILSYMILSYYFRLAFYKRNALNHQRDVRRNKN